MNLQFKKISILTTVGILLAAVAMHLKAPTIASDGGLPLANKFGSFVHDKNLRDLGKSLNECLGQEVFAENIVLRANVWFSGGSCDKVGDPAVIYSLNFAPERHERYFCVKEDGTQLIGRHFNEVTLNDLEFMAAWENPAMVAGSCGFLRDMLSSLGAHQRMLMHCDAGRDRTGTFAALLTALVAEHSGKLDEKMLDAIECDYRKTRSLRKAKYGRMKSFLQEIVKTGSVATFLQLKCHITPEEMQHGLAAFSKN